MKYKTNLYLLQRLWGHVQSKRKKQLMVLLLIMLISSLVDIFSIGAVVPFLSVIAMPSRVYERTEAELLIEIFKITDPSQLLLPISVIFLMAVLVSSLLRFFLLWMNTRISFMIGSEIGRDIYYKTLHQPYISHISRNSSQVITGIIGKTNTLVYSVIWPVLSIISALITIAMLAIVLLIIEPRITIIIIGFSVVYLAIVLRAKKMLSKDSEIIARESVMVLKALQEGLGGIRDIIIDGTQMLHLGIYSKADISLRNAQARTVFVASSPKFLIETLSIVLMVVVMNYMVMGGQDINSLIPFLGALALGAQRILPFMQQAYSSWANIQGGIESLVDSLELMDQANPILDTDARTMVFNKEIKLNGIYYQYEEDKIILDNINLSIQKGEKIGIIGVSGAGKSTLVDIILGLLKPTNGSISIDGCYLDEKNIRSWQRNIAHVPQSIFLMDSSIKENIALGSMNAQIEDAKIKDVAQEARLIGCFEGMNLKFDSPVGERGERLSGGQRQRLGLARALYKNSSVIIFDEVTSGLDKITQANVVKSIEEVCKNKTVIMISHEISTLTNCTKIIKVANGKVEIINNAKNNQ